MDTFLKQHPDLLWLREVFLHQFSSASETLHALSLSKDDTSISAMEMESSVSWHQLTLPNSKHCLNLAKISALAGRNVGCELKVRCIDADLNLLQLQEEILRFIPEDRSYRTVPKNSKWGSLIKSL